MTTTPPSPTLGTNALPLLRAERLVTDLHLFLGLVTDGHVGAHERQRLQFPSAQFSGSQKASTM
jgi:hypothetical protein